MTSICCLCNEDSVNILLDVGNQPICSRFLANPEAEEYTHPMVLGQCNTCGLIQLINPVLASELLPRYEWITYNEPEGHLDLLAERICSLPGLSPSASIGGVSFKDDTTLWRLKARSFSNTWRIDPLEDLGIRESSAGVETIQARLTPRSATRIAQKYGPADVLVVRHILEHASSLSGFMDAIRQMIRPQGYAVFEVPDCVSALEKKDYTSLWEEHTAYFTPETFRFCFALAGFRFHYYGCHPYPFENSLVAIVQPQVNNRKPIFLSGNALADEQRKAQAYAADFPQYSTRIKEYLNTFRRKKGKIALFGAGHLGCKYVNFFGLSNEVEFFVDDHPAKQGLFMPGSRLPIYSSAALLEKGIKLCLLSLNPLNEENVIQKHQKFVQQGGIFTSIFPGSKHALKI